MKTKKMAFPSILALIILTTKEEAKTNAKMSILIAIAELIVCLWISVWIIDALISRFTYVEPAYLGRFRENFYSILFIMGSMLFFTIGLFTFSFLLI